VAGAVAGVVLFLHSDAGNLATLFDKLGEIMESARATIPASLTQWLPAKGSNLEQQIVGWIKVHAQEVQSAGGAFGHVLLAGLVGIVIGGLVSLEEARNAEAQRPLAAAFGQSMHRLARAFRQVVFAQVRISALNTFLTAIYLVLVLPLLGISLPLIKTMVLLTFLVGLIPVLGNLISNTVIVVISLSYSLPAAIGSLIFLVVIHKLEYFINARIVGARINAAAWEILSVMLVMDAIFGVGGIVAAPIFYAYLKSEFISREWI
jgi:predicted PurR-regulated permease PerM